MANFIPFHVPNPNNIQRHEILKFLLKSDNRIEDYENIIKILSPPKPIEEICDKIQGKPFKVAIIGSGISGLCTGYELNKIGCNITIFEASNRIGGRINTHYFNKENNQYGDLGAMRIGISHETTWHYIKKFNLKTRPFVSKSTSSLFFIGGNYAVNDSNGKSIMENIYPYFKLKKNENKTPPNKLIEKMYKKYFYSLNANERKELLEIRQNYSYKIKEIQNLSLRQGYENSSLSQNAISMTSYISTLEADLLHISLYEILAEFYTFDFVYNYTLEGGMINLPLAFYNNLISSDGPGKINFKFGCLINSIIKSPYTDKIILEVVNTNYNNCYYEEFDFVVCAIPFSSLRKIEIKPSLNPLKNQSINEINYEIGQKTFLYLKERFWEKDKNNVLSGTTLTDLITISTIYPSDHLVAVEDKLYTYKPSNSSTYREPGVLLASYNWNQNAVRLGNDFNPLKLKKICRIIEIIHKLPNGYIEENLINYSSMLWSNVPFIYGGVCLMTPGQKEIFLYEATLPEMNNKLFFTGEHVSSKHGWIQGSLQSAMNVANNIAKIIRQRY